MLDQGSLLIIGGAGYIGSHTVRYLLNQKRRIVVLDNLIYGHEDALPLEQVTFIKGEMANEELIESIFQSHKIEAVLHLAAFAAVGESVMEPLRYYRNNVQAPLVVLEAMQRHGVKKFIFSSTCATYGDPVYLPMDENHPQVPVNPYGASKLMLERILTDCDHAWGLKSVFLRYFNASGSSFDGSIGEDHQPETHLIPRVLLAILGRLPEMTVFGTDYPTPDGTCIRDYIHVVDLARAHALALNYLEQGGEQIAVNLGTGRGFSVQEIIKAAEEVTGRKVPLSFGDRRPGDPAELVANPEKAKQVLGWEAEFKDPKAHIESAWLWFTGERQGRYEK